MDIREFYKSNQKQNNANFDNLNQNITDKQQTKSTKDFSDYQDTINKYKNLSQDELVSELFNQASDLKAKGKLNTDMLNQISTTLTPMLNNDQQQLLNELVSKLK